MKSSFGRFFRCGTMVVSLLYSFSSTPTITYSWILTDTLAEMMPNLRFVNVSGSRFHGPWLEELTKQCSRLEKLTYNNIRPWTHIFANGKKLTRAKELRELNMDNSSFEWAPHQARMLDPIDIEEMSDLDKDEYSTIFLFHKCGSTVLERISIKNATWYDGRGPTVISQTALIKFIRNAPLSLRYFGSDLSQENIEMLRSEEGGRGAEIEFG